MKKIIIILMLLIFSPSIVFAEDTTPKKKEDPSMYLLLGVLSFAGGLYFINQADSFESSHSDPYEYDQADVRSRADVIRRQGYLGIGIGIANFVIWRIKYDQYNVSFRQQDGYTSLVLATRF